MVSWSIGSLSFSLPRSPTSLLASLLYSAEMRVQHTVFLFFSVVSLERRTKANFQADLITRDGNNGLTECLVSGKRIRSGQKGGETKTKLPIASTLTKQLWLSTPTWTTSSAAAPTRTATATATAFSLAFHFSALAFPMKNNNNWQARLGERPGRRSRRAAGAEAMWEFGLLTNCCCLFWARIRGGAAATLAATCAWYFASRQTHKIYALAKKWGKAGARGTAAAAGAEAEAGVVEAATEQSK